MFGPLEFSYVLEIRKIMQHLQCIFKASEVLRQRNVGFVYIFKLLIEIKKTKLVSTLNAFDLNKQTAFGT